MSTRDVAAGIASVSLLARGRAIGLELLDGSPYGAWRSFVAMFVAAPFFLALKLLSAPPMVAGADPVRLWLAEAIGYVVGWFALPLVMVAVARMLDRLDRWPLFVCAWNWTNLAQVMVFLAAALLAAALPRGLGQLVTLVALGYVLWLQWFVARESLDIPGPRAIAVVGVDLVLGLFISGLTLSVALVR
ncbi:hypothetical protein [Elioraea sp.]|uniref:hypothetical protein n=1 Tax=Elioraea sp. TaxID=2185103 RepID=UPI003F7185E1